MIQLLEHDNNALINGESLSILLNITNINGETPLHLAILEENLEACRILITKGADVNLAKHRGIVTFIKEIFLNDKQIRHKIYADKVKLTKEFGRAWNPSFFSLNMMYKQMIEDTLNDVL